MYDGRSYCGNCGHHNPPTSHWHVGTKRFCSRLCYYTYQNVEHLQPMNGHQLEAIPRHPGVWGKSPKYR